MTKAATYDPGGIVVRCKRCHNVELVEFDAAPFMAWPPPCPICAARLIHSPMLAYQTQRRRKVGKVIS